jgi:hypothetical protein
VALQITYYEAVPLITYMSDQGNWNILIGNCAMSAAGINATFWK